MLVTGDNQISLAGNRAFQDTVIRLVILDFVQSNFWSNDLGDVGEQFHPASDEGIIPLES